MLTSDIFAYRALYFFDNTRDFYGTSMWSLHQEIKLYLIFPLLLYLIKKYSNRYNFIFATLIIYYIAISIIALYGHDVKKFYGHNLWAFTMCWNKLNGVFFGIAFERCLIGFALGILIAIHGKIIKLSDYWFLAIIIICIAFVKFNFISCFLVIFSFAHLMPKIISSNLIISTKATNFWTKMGYLSYPIYLFQDRTIMRFMKFANKYFALDTNLYIFIMFSCIAIYIIAIYIISETYEKWIINKIKNLKFAKQIQAYSRI